MPTAKDGQIVEPASPHIPQQEVMISPIALGVEIFQAQFEILEVSMQLDPTALTVVHHRLAFA